MSQQDRSYAQKRKLQQELNIEFRRTVAQKYEAHCGREGIEPTLDGLIEFAYRHSLIRDTDINRYMVIDMYPMALYEANGCKTRAVQSLEDRVPLSDRNIWGLIRNLKSRYMAYRNGRSQKVQ